MSQRVEQMDEYVVGRGEVEESFQQFGVLRSLDYAPYQAWMTFLAA